MNRMVLKISKNRDKTYEENDITFDLKIQKWS